jgi:hypothetical protein
MEVPSDRELMRELSDVLGASGLEVSDAVLKRVSQEPVLLHHLVVTQQDPELLRYAVLALEAATAREQEQARPRAAGSGETAPAVGSGEIMVRAATALGRWVGSGFRKTDAVQAESRLRRCAACPHLREIDVTGAYRLLSSAKRDLICNLCGCLVRNKARLVTETCPDTSWGPSGRWETP